LDSSSTLLVDVTGSGSATSVQESGYDGNGDGNDGDHSSGNGGTPKPIGNVSPTVLISSAPTSYAKLFIGDKSKKSVNFHTLITPTRNGVDVVVPRFY
ncbi:hypothetical protein Tco_1148050, partial [Tanacetum coccineum]